MTRRLYIPQDTTARAVGADRLARAWEKERGVEIVRTSSRGAFYLEPLVETDGPQGRIGWPNVTAQGLPKILRGEGGTPISDIPFLAKQTRAIFANAGVTRPLSLEDYKTHGGFAGLEAALRLAPEKIVEELSISKLRGRGGAAFPVGRKWQTALETHADQKYVVANADEGDAGTYCDRMVMEGEPFRLIEGMLIAAYAIGATKGYIYCRYEYPAAAAMLEAAIGILTAAGYMGPKAAVPFDVEVFVGAGSYVCGEETALLQSLEGKRGMVQPKPPYPAVSGLYGKPTLVSNVLTFATVPAILARGAAWHASLGTEHSKGTIALQIGGRVKQPGLAEVPFGLSLEEAIEQFGGGMATGARFKAVQVGGPLGSLFTKAGLKTRICYDEFARAGAILGHGGIVVFDQETDMLALARHFMAFTADESCGACTPCRVGSVRAREVLDGFVQGRGRPGDLDLLADLGETMKQTSLCALGQRAPYPVLTAIEHFRKEFR
ncbi:MAG: formate dehydrogenase [Nitrospirae bacterium]|nr:MAG: formate dehydrogenase [Nitrospirota bacterium]